MESPRLAKVLMPIMLTACAPEVAEDSTEATCAIHDVSDSTGTRALGVTRVELHANPIASVPETELPSVSEQYTLKAEVFTGCDENYQDCADGVRNNFMGFNPVEANANCEATINLPVDVDPTTGTYVSYSPSWEVVGPSQEDSTMTLLTIERDYELLDGSFVSGRMDHPELSGGWPYKDASLVVGGVNAGYPVEDLEFSDALSSKVAWVNNGDNAWQISSPE